MDVYFLDRAGRRNARYFIIVPKKITALIIKVLSPLQATPFH